MVRRVDQGVGAAGRASEYLEAFAAINTVDGVSWRPLATGATIRARFTASWFLSHLYSYLARNEPVEPNWIVQDIQTGSNCIDACARNDIAMPHANLLIELQLIMPRWHFDDFNDL